MTLNFDPDTLSLPKGHFIGGRPADHSTYGPAVGFFTRHLSPASRLPRRLQAAWVNRYGRSRDHILPVGGYNQSVIGKNLGREAYIAPRKSKSVLISL